MLVQEPQEVLVQESREVLVQDCSKVLVQDFQGVLVQESEEALAGTGEQGVYTGGLSSANSLVKEGRADARDFKMVSGYSGWQEGQLESEIAAGHWYVVAASTAVLKSVIRKPLSPPPPTLCMSASFLHCRPFQNRVHHCRPFPPLDSFSRLPIFKPAGCTRHCMPS